MKAKHLTKGQIEAYKILARELPEDLPYAEAIRALVRDLERATPTNDKKFGKTQRFAKALYEQPGAWAHYGRYSVPATATRLKERFGLSTAVRKTPDGNVDVYARFDPDNSEVWNVDAFHDAPALEKVRWQDPPKRSNRAPGYGGKGPGQVLLRKAKAEPGVWHHYRTDETLAAKYKLAKTYGLETRHTKRTDGMYDIEARWNQEEK